MKHKLRINLLASWGDHLIGFLIGLFLMPFVLNTLGDDRYGLWLLICSIAGYSGLLNFGFAETVSRFVAHHRANNEADQINRVVSVVSCLYLVLSVAMLAVAGVIAFLLPYCVSLDDTSVGELRTVVLLLGSNVIVGIAGSVFGGVIVGLQRMDVERGIRSISGIGRLVLTVALLRREYGLVTLAGIFLATTLIENIGYAVVVFRLLPTLRISWRLFNRQTLKECFGFSLYSFLDGISLKLIEATDTVVIGFFLGTRAIVPYYVSLRMTQFITQPLQHIGAVAMPRGAELEAHSRSDGLRELVQKGLGVSFLLTTAFFVGAVYFGDQVLGAWIGRSYPETHLVLMILLGSQVIATPIKVLRGVLFGMGHVKKPALLYLGEAGLNLALSLILVKPLGVVGVALGTAIPIVLVELGALLPFALKKLQFSSAEFFRSIVAPQLMPLLGLWAYSVVVATHCPVSPSWLSVISVSAGGGVVLAASWLLARRQVFQWQMADGR